MLDFLPAALHAELKVEEIIKDNAIAGVFKFFR